MFIVRNNGKFPILIRDLSLHISGEKEIDLDTIIKRENADKSFNLQKMIETKKLEVIKKDNIVTKRVEQKTIKEQEINPINNSVLMELRKDISSIKDLLMDNRISSVHPKEKLEELDEETKKKLVDLKVRNFSKDGSGVEKNYNQLGTSTEKIESLDSLLNTLDDLDRNGDK